MAWPIIGRSFSISEFEAYVEGLEWDGKFRPDGIALHNTAAPSLAQRPNGLTKQHILNLQTYYRTPKPKGCGWSGGPHLFIDDRQIWVFNDLTKSGVHSPSWNRTKLGIEMLGDFDTESFTAGRGRKVRDNTVAAVAILNKKLGFAADAFKFHCEDKATTHACPGKLARAERKALIAEIEAAMAAGVDGAAADEEDAIPLHVDATETSSNGPKPGLFDNFTFAKVNELADQGSRVAGWIKSIKRWFWGVAATGGSTVALVDPKKGSANAFVDLVRDHPFWAIGITACIAGLVVYATVKVVEKHLVTAAKDGRYRPRGAE